MCFKYAKPLGTCSEGNQLRNKISYCPWLQNVLSVARDTPALPS